MYIDVGGNCPLRSQNLTLLYLLTCYRKLLGNNLFKKQPVTRQETRAFTHRPKTRAGVCIMLYIHIYMLFIYILMGEDRTFWLWPVTMAILPPLSLSLLSLSFSLSLSLSLSRVDCDDGYQRYHKGN